MYEFQSFARVSLCVVILAPITIVIISRAITVYGVCAILHLAKAKYTNFGRIGGGIAVAMVLSLPIDYKFKNLLIAK